MDLKVCFIHAMRGGGGWISSNLLEQQLLKILFISVDFLGQAVKAELHREFVFVEKLPYFFG